jgi:RimJ/RimL family protein N-acetyltransferase
MLKGQKVTLRPVEREDLKRIHELSQDVELSILAESEYQPRSLAHWEKRFEKHLETEPAWFVIEADAQIIGDTGLHGLDRQHGTAELGIAIWDRAFLGKGYGRDAVNVLLEWAFDAQNWRRIWLTALASNERAIRSYLACGFVEEGRLRQHDFFHGEYVDMVVMGLLRSEWEARRSRT